MDIDYALMARVLGELPGRFNARREALGLTVAQVWLQDQTVSLSSLHRFANTNRDGTGGSNIATYRVVLLFMARTEPAGPGPTPDRPTPDTPDGSR